LSSRQHTWSSKPTLLDALAERSATTEVHRDRRCSAWNSSTMATCVLAARPVGELRRALISLPGAGLGASYWPVALTRAAEETDRFPAACLHPSDGRRTGRGVARGSRRARSALHRQDGAAVPPSTAWSTTANAPSNSSISTTSWRCSKQRQSGAGATSRCRFSTATVLSASSTPRPTARRAPSPSTLHDEVRFTNIGTCRRGSRNRGAGGVAGTPRRPGATRPSSDRS
jgi:hypothetical protein